MNTTEAEEALSFEVHWEALRTKLAKKYSCSLELRKVVKPGEKPYFFLDGAFVGSRICLARLKDRCIFPWEKILPELHDLLDQEYGVGKYYLVTINSNYQAELR